MSDILLSILSGGVAGSIAVFILKSWIQAKVTNSIRLEYDKKFELFRRELDQQQKVELVSELLAEWIRTPKGEPMTREQRTLLNRLSFQVSLWLPSDLAIELSKTIQGQVGAKTIFEILLLARQVITGDSTLIPSHITFWKAEHEKHGDLSTQENLS